MVRATAEDCDRLSHLFGATISEGRILAKNTGVCVEERYDVAYNLGSGRSPWPGWINVDSGTAADLNADLRKLPVESDTADAVAAIHVLEHFFEWEAVPILTEWKRILKPGGKLILELPCLDKIFAYVFRAMKAKEPVFEFMTLHAMYGDPKHKDPLMMHRTGYFKYQVEAKLKEVGFREIKDEVPNYHFVFRDMRITAIK